MSVITIPTEWADISVSKYVELIQTNFDASAMSKFAKNIVGNYLSLEDFTEKDLDELGQSLCILMDIDEADYEKFDLYQVTMLISKLKFLGKPLDKNLDPEQMLKKPFNQMSVGEAIDIEEYISAGVEDNLFAIMQILTGCEADTPITKVYKTTIDYFAYRKQLFQNFQSLFVDNEIHDEDELTDEDKSDIKRETKWAWYSFLFNLAGGDFEKMHQVTERNFVGALNYFAYMKENKVTK